MHVDDARVLVGPGGLPGTPGCPTCAHRRREHNRPDAAERAELAARFGVEPFERHTPLLISATAAVAAELATAEMEHLLGGTPHPVQWSLNLATAAMSTHPIVADPLCPDCSRLPDDGPEATRELLTPTPKPHPRAFHTRDLTATLPELQRIYVDAETGMIRSITDWPTGVCPAA
ncbi:TOMM precursor leader peptide-binding protein, partial [Nocardia gipuzkoensis]